MGIKRIHTKGQAVDCHRKNAARAAQWELCAAERELLVSSFEVVEESH